MRITSIRKDWRPYTLPLIFTAITFSNAVSGKTLSVDFAPALLNSTDDYLVPFYVGSSSTQVLLAPALNLDEIAVLSTKTCTPKGQSKPKEMCAQYRNLLYDEGSDFDNGAPFDWEVRRYESYMRGKMGTESVKLGSKTIDDMSLAVVQQCNTTSGWVGLGKNSALLDRLVKDGIIESKSYGIHFGIDIWNHPDPIWDPSFEEEEKKGPSDSYDEKYGRRKAKRQDEYSILFSDSDGVIPKRRVHSFPGSLTLGGYDKSKIDSRNGKLTAPIVNGALELEVTDMTLENVLLWSPFDLLNTTRKAVIDSTTPWVHLPYTTVEYLRYKIYALSGNPQVLYQPWHGDEYIGTINFTVQAPGDKSTRMTISVPPTVWFQPISEMFNYEPVGENHFDFQAPIRSFPDGWDEPIILGRAFLKAVYLYVNHETNQFQLSQASFKNSTSDIVAVSANVKDIGSESDLENGSSNGSGSSKDEESSGPPIGIIAGAAGGGVALIALIIAAVFFIRKKKSRNGTSSPHKKISSIDGYIPPGGRMELDADETAKPRPSTVPVSPAVSVHEYKHQELPAVERPQELDAPTPTISAPQNTFIAELPGDSFPSNKEPSANTLAPPNASITPTRTPSPTYPPSSPSQTLVSCVSPMSSVSHQQYPPPPTSPYVPTPLPANSYPPPPHAPPQQSYNQYPPPPGPPPPVQQMPVQPPRSPNPNPYVLPPPPPPGPYQPQGQGYNPQSYGRPGAGQQGWNAGY